KLQLMTGVEPTVLVQRPWAYLVPASFTSAVETLQRHGIVVEELSKPADIETQVYKVDSATTETRAFQKHKLVTLEVTRRDEKQTLPQGTLLIPPDNRLGTLASYLLEPQSEDGLATWNVFDAGIEKGKDFPVLRVPKEVKLVTQPVKAPA